MKKILLLPLMLLLSTVSFSQTLRIYADGYKGYYQNGAELELITTEVKEIRLYIVDSTQIVGIIDKRSVKYDILDVHEAEDEKHYALEKDETGWAYEFRYNQKLNEFTIWRKKDQTLLRFTNVEASTY